MDLNVPGGTGAMEAVGRLLKEDSEARVIVSSGCSEDPIMGRVRQLRDSGSGGGAVRDSREFSRALNSAIGD